MNHPNFTDPRLDPTRTIRAPRGSEKVCKTWLAEVRRSTRWSGMAS
ncbi:hypothetical protein FHX59_000744 [Paraburkholderia silvatlantica]|uniref:Uncharacterized protein n=1 Tax=Paraburkholderia silvatlantica TaxID=321895 RepID=A0A2V4U2G7_9BURK|nr:hypothetical protein [Paraburkholderia silvatlantica]MBB2926337.1 hypothetical protein [Paraburkholderia silvatlantica]PYE14754.1 hypothetical protein C7410_1372 [Paraburkholderia silvatlantica]